MGKISVDYEIEDLKDAGIILDPSDHLGCLVAFYSVSPEATPARARTFLNRVTDKKGWKLKDVTAMIEKDVEGFWAAVEKLDDSLKLATQPLKTTAGPVEPVEFDDDENNALDQPNPAAEVYRHLKKKD